MADKFKITILLDGTIKTDSDGISMANHGNAEKLSQAIAQAAGGETERTRKAGARMGHIHNGVYHEH